MNNFLFFPMSIILVIFLQQDKVQSKEIIKRSVQSNSIDFFSPCKLELTKLFEKLSSKNLWQRQAPSRDNNQVFRTPTLQFGHWLEVVLNTESIPTVYSILNEETTVYTYDRSCNETSLIKEGLNFKKTSTDTSSSKWFNDSDLAKLLSESKSGLIYVWSPEMTYSAQYYKNFQDVAKKMKMDFKMILDPRTQFSQVGYFTKKYDVPTSNIKLNSVELYMRNLTIHYPTTIVYSNGTLSNLPIVGVLNTDDLEAAVRRSLLEINNNL